MGKKAFLNIIEKIVMQNIHMQVIIVHQNYY